MKHIVSLSGGIGSYFALKRLLDQQPKEDVIAVFCDTLAEDGDLYRFLDDIGKKFELEIIRLCHGKSPIELAFQEKYIFNSRVAPCSRILKSEPFTNWLKDNYQSDEATIYFGIDFTESHRCAAITRNYAPYGVRFPLCQEPYLYKNELIQMLMDDGIEIPRLYKLGFSHNNCKGFCFKAGIGHYKNLLEKDRITYLEAENKEQMLMQYIGKDHTILKRKGESMSLRQLREMVDNAPEQLTLFECQDVGGCGCFVEE